MHLNIETSYATLTFEIIRGIVCMIYRPDMSNTCAKLFENHSMHNGTIAWTQMVAYKH